MAETFRLRIYFILLGQWLNFKLFGITYLVGTIKFKLFISGSSHKLPRPISWSSLVCHHWKSKNGPVKAEEFNNPGIVWIFCLFSGGRFLSGLKPRGRFITISKNHFFGGDFFLSQPPPAIRSFLITSPKFEGLSDKTIAFVVLGLPGPYKLPWLMAFQPTPPNVPPAEIRPC